MPNMWEIVRHFEDATWKTGVFAHRVPRLVRVMVTGWEYKGSIETEALVTFQGPNSDICTFAIQDHEKLAQLFEQLAKDIREAKQIEESERARRDQQ